MKVKVTERALLARINRALRKDNQQLCRCREDSQGYAELGDFYAMDTAQDVVMARHVDLAMWARDLGILPDWEELQR
ncbi:hypothetical protein [Azotobacter salinestris]|uniref:hypothetical protein n=1 Tax=Azotobacter salinestris TaxID=69964 RepID=UPI001266AD7E|nr:hypothetical protein [Azotobacter salinestris]